MLKFVDLRKTPSLEIGLMLVFSYAPYALAEGLRLSGTDPSSIPPKLTFYQCSPKIPSFGTKRIALSDGDRLPQVVKK